MSYSLQQLTLRETHRQKMVQSIIEVITGRIQPEVTAQGKQLQEMIQQARDEVMMLSAERRKQLVDARPRNSDYGLSFSVGVGVVKGSI
jgi:hypothetical protein